MAGAGRYRESVWQQWRCTIHCTERKEGRKGVRENCKSRPMGGRGGGEKGREREEREVGSLLLLFLPRLTLELTRSLAPPEKEGRRKGEGGNLISLNSGDEKEGWK